MLFSRFRTPGQRSPHGKHPSRQLGLEIFVLAGLTAIVPTLVVAGFVLFQAEKSLNEHAVATLTQDAQRYSDEVLDRLQHTWELLPVLASGATVPTHEIFRQLESHAVLDASGTRLDGTLALPASALRAFQERSISSLVADHDDGRAALYLSRPVDDRLVIGMIASDYAWQADAFEDMQIVCSFATSQATPLYCSTELSSADLAAMRSTNSFEGSSGEQTFLVSSTTQRSPAEFLPTDVQLLVAQNRESIFRGAMQLRDLYLPTLGIALLLALIGAFVYSRRILYPLVRMLDVTRELTNRDVWGRADLRRQDHFSNFAHDLQHMADDLAQQFNARETLSRIDQAILSGAETSQIVDLVLQHLVESVSCRRAVVTLLSPDEELPAFATKMSRGHPVTRGSEIRLTPESRAWLQRHVDGVILSGPARGTPGEAFAGVDTPHTYVLPILVQGEPAAAVSIMAMTESVGTDENQRAHVRDLAGRLAVALEVVSRSEALHRKAFFDDLTGLPNRDFCFQRLDNAIKHAKSFDGSVAVMFIDLDGFKAINDSLGHIAGDELIRQAATRLSRCIGEAGTIGRLGGDEFGVVLPFQSESLTPESLAEQVLDTISEPFQIATSEIHLSASIGVARYPDDGDSRVELLRKADTAMYSAKEAGRGRKIDYSNTMGIKVDERMRLEAELRRALENDELCVYYQPQIDMRSGRIVSAEALLRWNHPERGLVLPGEFVPIAEDSGYINVLGGWIMKAACQQLSTWMNQGLGIKRVSVNVSAGQFRRNDFVDMVESSLFDLQFASDVLEIELTERVFVEDITQARKTLQRLKELGVVVSIDDFGTGYSSLGYLKHLTFDAVKIDQSFVHELPGDTESEAIVRSVLAMCHTLGKQVVAEGIESDQQFAFLREAGVDFGQGYRIGRPMIADEFARFVMSNAQRLEREQTPRRVG